MSSRDGADLAGSTMVEPLQATGTLATLPVAAGGPVLALAYSEDGRGPEFAPLPPDGAELGRGCTLWPAGPLADARISRQHARIVRDKRREQWVLQDVGSSNGTLLNGVTVTEPTVLLPGDVMRLGNTLIVFVELHGDPTDPEAPAFDGLVGESEAIVAVRRTVTRVAPHDSSVLITGETGTGKEVVARAIHQASNRPGQFIAINCGAVSGGVLESELFGHVRGAFTGAAQARKGLFRAADGGTLFLDELGEMPQELQVKLLRVLEAKVVRPVGGNQEEAIDVRVVAATNRDLVAEVRAGRFRSDLFARLLQWPVTMPPLRSRREDIPLLARHLLARKGSDAPLAVDLAEALMLHHWPHNVRGLANVMSVALIGASSDRITTTPEVAALLESDLALMRAEPDRSSVLITATTSLAPPAPGDETRPMVKRVGELPDPEALAEALRASRGSVAAAARSLGCSRQQLYRLIETLELDLDQFRDG